MTEQPSEEYEDVYPLLGAIGPYLSFTTGHLNPIDEDEEYPEDDLSHVDSLDIEPEIVCPEEDNSDYWEDDER